MMFVGNFKGHLLPITLYSIKFLKYIICPILLCMPSIFINFKNLKKPVLLIADDLNTTLVNPNDLFSISFFKVNDKMLLLNSRLVILS